MHMKAIGAFLIMLTLTTGLVAGSKGSRGGGRSGGGHSSGGKHSGSSHSRGGSLGEGSASCF